jgi:hypothetical protein
MSPGLFTAPFAQAWDKKIEKYICSTKLLIRKGGMLSCTDGGFES